MRPVHIILYSRPKCSVVMMSPCYCCHSAIGKELIVFGGSDNEEAEMCTQGVYVFDTGGL